MHAIKSINRAVTVFANAGRPVSEMNDDQRKAVMAKLGGGGYSGGARGGGSPMRKQRAQFSRLSQEMELRRQGQTGLQTALTPVELLMSTGLEAGLDSINQTRESTDNRMVDLALGAAGVALLAAGFRNGLKNINQAKAVRAAATRKNVEAIFEQMASDAARFSHYASAKTATIPRSTTGDIFRAEAAKHGGSMRGMYMDYARRADLESVSPRMVKDPWTSAKDVLRKTELPSRNAPPSRMTQLETAARTNPNQPAMELGFFSTKSVGDLLKSMKQETAHYARQKASATNAGKSYRPNETAALYGNRKDTPMKSTWQLLKTASLLSLADVPLANSMPMSDSQRKAMFAKMGMPGGRTMSAPVSASRPKAAVAPLPQPSLPVYTRPDLNLDQGRAIPGNERPPKTIDFDRFDHLFKSFKEAFPKDQSGLAFTMDSILRPFRENPANFFDDPAAVKQLFDLVAPHVAINTGSKNYETKRGAMESSFYAQGLQILHGAGLMPGWTMTSTFGPGGFQGVRFWNERPSFPTFSSSGTKPTMTELYRHGGGASLPMAGGQKVSPSSKPVPWTGKETEAPRTASGGYAPRTDIFGRVFYGPTPGERGYIDHDAWRRGAMPKGPVSQPKPNQKVDTVSKAPSGGNRSTPATVSRPVYTTSKK